MKINSVQTEPDITMFWSLIPGRWVEPMTGEDKKWSYNNKDEKVLPWYESVQEIIWSLIGKLDATPKQVFVLASERTQTIIEFGRKFNITKLNQEEVSEEGALGIDKDIRFLYHHDAIEPAMDEIVVVATNGKYGVVKVLDCLI